MPTIKRILHFEDKDSYGVAHVLLDDGTEAQVYIGGDVEVFFHKQTIKAHVKRNKLDKLAGV